MLRKLIPETIKKRIKRRLYYRYNRPALAALKNSPAKKRLILLLTPTYGNIGDHAISWCERMFLRDYFEDHTVIEISDICWEYEKKTIISRIKKDDCLLFNGGGFLGDLWEGGEEEFRETVKAFPDNKIVVLPQSVFFTDNEHGQEQINISSGIYAGHSRLVLCVREKQSYECVKNNLLIRDTDKCFLMPDMVTYCTEDFSGYTRGGHVLLCFRNDKEKITDPGTVSRIETVLSEAGLEFSYTDTVVPYRLLGDRGEKAVSQKLQEFVKCRFVITDRLHGMLLSAISGTPCLFMDNCSKKVSGTYEWIKNLEYIKPLKDMENLKAFISRLESGQVYRYTNEHLQPYYEKLVQLIRNDEILE